MPAHDDSPLRALDDPEEEWMRLVQRSERPRVAGEIGSHVILEEIRRGGQSVVFRARQASTGREIALKRLAAGAFSSAADRRRFEREIELVADLVHPGIVTVYGVEDVDGVPLLEMEWVDGVPLTEHVARISVGRAGQREKLRIFLEVCDAVQYAHARGVIHRDLKPSNILVDSSGRCRLLDFGVARRLLSVEDAETTRTLGFIGTPAYAAPEHFTEGAAPLDARTDVYSLGVILYECLAGCRPYRETKLHALLREIEEGALSPPSTFGADVDRELDALVARAMARDPEDRYPTVHALAEDIGRYLDGRTLSAVPAQAHYVLRKWIRRNRMAFCFSILLATLLMCAATIGLWQASVIAAERNEAQHQTERAREAHSQATAALDVAREEADRARAAEAESRAALERARSQTEKAEALHSLYLNGIQATTTPNGDVREAHLGTVLDFVVREAPARFTNHPGVAITLLIEAAHAYLWMSNPGQAERVVQEALELLTEDSDPRFAAALTGLRGQITFWTGDYRGAAELLDEARALYEGQPESPLFLMTRTTNLFALGTAYRLAGLGTRAEQAYLEAREFGVLSDAHETIVSIDSHRAGLLAERGEFDGAERLLTQAQAYADAHVAADDFCRIYLWVNRSTTAFEKREYAKAAEAQVEVVRTLREHGRTTGEPFDSERIRLARRLAMAGDCVSAVETLEEALASSPTPIVSVLRKSIGACSLADQGDLDGAAQLAEAAWRECSALTPHLAYSRALTLALQFDVLARAGRYEEAERVFVVFAKDTRARVNENDLPETFFLELVAQHVETLGYELEFADLLDEILACEELQGAQRMGVEALRLR